ncbi:glycerophosphodiester phosphodiesterase family protein [Candidatus Sumerlaeota bacterium]|nr:glycerophosphodiester phosphodiesterase family protein [Candidatus Sumerlaeota bacterium]
MFYRLLRAASVLAVLVIVPRPLHAFEFFEPVQPPRRVQVMVHRGEAGQAPENTRAALVRCIEDGFEWAEIDLRLTKDHVHVLSHDSKVDAKSDGTGLIEDLTVEELKKLDAGSWFAPRYSHETFLTFSECLELAKGKLNLYLDCKETDPELLAKEVLGAGMEKQVVAFDDLPNLKRIKDASGGKIAVMPKWFPKDGMGDWLDELQPAAVEINADIITPEIAAAFHEKGIKVQTKNLGEWDNPEFWDRAADAGADWLQTDLPEEITAHNLWRRVAKRPVMISLHRGANRYAPENTIPAFEKAIRLGSDYVEFDVRTTNDGKLFLLHDGQLNRTTAGQGMISAWSSADVAPLIAGAWFGKPCREVKIPSLDQFLDAAKGKVKLYFDAKSLTPEALAAAISSAGLEEQTEVYQGADFLKKLKAVNPRIGRMPPLDSYDEIDKLADEIAPTSCDAQWRILSKELIDHCHARGIKVFSDALGAHEKVEDYLQAMRWGIDLIQTDHPMRVMRAIELFDAENVK